MRKIFIDTNVLLDSFLNRKPNSESAFALVKACIEGKYVAFTSATSMLNFHYVIRKELSAATSLKIINDTLQFIKVIDADTATFQFAIESKFKDFEDAVQYYTAKKITNIAAFITNNKKDFIEAAIPIYTTNEFLLNN